VLTVTRLDRLARSTRDLLNHLATITAKKAGFRSLGDTWADTTTSHGRLMLTVLGGLAEFERDLIRARTSEGRERAKARGVKMGRPLKSMNSSALLGSEQSQRSAAWPAPPTGGVRVQAVLPGTTRTELWDRSGTPLDSLPANTLMDVDELVDAALSGLDQAITIPSLEDPELWQAYSDARTALGPYLSRRRAASRYNVTPRGAAGLPAAWSGHAALAGYGQDELTAAEVDLLTFPTRW
jgi:Resolvase, N terminal domain